MTILSYILLIIVRLFTWSYRFTFYGNENLEKARALSPVNSYIMSIWHQNLFAGIMAQWGTPHVVIVSRSKDAEPLARVLKMMGHTAMRGSSKKGNVDKGGKLAKNDMEEVLRSGIPGAITVDGPKGPAHVVKPGIVSMAKQTGCTLVPYVAIADKNWIFNSWDKFRLPKPFAKVLINYGEPILIPENLEGEGFESFAKELGQKMHELEKSTRKYFEK